MNRPGPEVMQAIERLNRTSDFQTLKTWLGDNLAIANTNLQSFDGPELHRTQGDARTITAILNTASDDTGTTGRPGQGRAR